LCHPVDANFLPVMIVLPAARPIDVCMREVTSKSAGILSCVQNANPDVVHVKAAQYGSTDSDRG
jgi:hypothetical protein